jgi:hypothetical protein
MRAIKKIKEKTGFARSTIFEHLTSYVLRGEIFRKSGRYWLKKHWLEKTKTTKKGKKAR